MSVRFSAPVRIRRPPRFGTEHRLHAQQAHPPETVEAVRQLVETTRLAHKIIAQRIGIDPGTVSRWRAKYGWKRPPGAAPSYRMPGRYVPVLIGRSLAQRLRIQAERFVAEMEQAQNVDPRKLQAALLLLDKAREEQAIRRGKRREPPPGHPPLGTPKRPRKTDRRVQNPSRHDRQAAALKGWKKRYSKRERHHAWMLGEE
jgi:hypothetical protein